MADTVLDLAKEALEELGRYRSGESLNNDDANLVLRRYNRLLDAWNAERGQIYADLFTTYTFTPNLNPHTIGPTGTLVVTDRPVSIDGANVWLGTTPNVKAPIQMRDKEWFNLLRVPALSVIYPTDCWYNPVWPNGELHFYPVPSSAYQFELWTRSEFTVATLATVFALPQGYRRAHALTLAEEIADSFGAEISPRLAMEASKARRLVSDNNHQPKRLATRDAGIPTSGNRTKTFNYLSREGA